MAFLFTGAFNRTKRHLEANIAGGSNTLSDDITPRCTKIDRMPLTLGSAVMILNAECLFVAPTDIEKLLLAIEFDNIHRCQRIAPLTT